jgi:hypothetical protein
MTSLHFSTHFFPPFENLKVTSLMALPFYIYFTLGMFVLVLQKICKTFKKLADLHPQQGGLNG